MVFPGPFPYPCSCRLWSEPRDARTTVWALPRSLAATCGIIIIFSSSGYLDVSVHRVPSAQLCIHCTVLCSAQWVSPFRDLRIKAYLQLPAAYRSLSRLSSALSAKASALRPFLLNLLSFFRKIRSACSPTASWRIMNQLSFVICLDLQITYC